MILLIFLPLCPLPQSTHLLLPQPYWEMLMGASWTGSARALISSRISPKCLTICSKSHFICLSFWAEFPVSCGPVDWCSLHMTFLWVLWRILVKGEFSPISPSLMWGSTWVILCSDVSWEREALIYTHFIFNSIFIFSLILWSKLINYLFKIN